MEEARELLRGSRTARCIQVLDERRRPPAASTIGRDRINSDTGNKGGMICCQYADSVSMSHLQQQQQQQQQQEQAFSASVCHQHPAAHPS